MTNYYFDMDGVLANFHEHKDGWKRAMYYDFIRSLKPFQEAIDLVNEMLTRKEVEIYISSLAASEDAKRAKLDWLAQYIPNLKVANVIILVGSGKRNKADYMKTEDGILVDDKEENVKAWRKQGHKAVFVATRGEIHLEEVE